MLISKKIIFSASRIVEKNGLLFLIMAMEFLPKEYVLIISGGGEVKRWFRKSYREILDNKIKELGLEKRVYFTGHLEQQELVRMYQSANVFCRPSLSEGFGNVFIESIVSGVPVVAPNEWGIKDLFKDFPEMMFDCGVKNPKLIAEKIQEADARFSKSKIVLSVEELMGVISSIKS